ncbi:tRNA (adenosine(37)-N6)-dimethylallyltransferase MiaA [Seleniivibrio woodruffii]|uniref:tRNA dimethylallyltransferase n=1 Tax=Seleniivibrio woodruffii TaxID=1078050 RepID=A0A4R1K895_9BACT|nr:tRNA (adenosine(37)-N6)-dimethylallyltransferase MiaA [Seleniivibrio woodruffii]TCK60525.1 tRNA dimethylallyltransferase [Seleniivibrio woodruffii]TVZ36153.1 tRNA dimethylallyltransferase [Seleniivibrio woodruffii]
MRIPVVTGPTASGKTAAVLGLAKDHPIEIISADAYQVYRHMDIGTAKASREELESVPHHLIDVMNPDETYSAGIFFEQAERIIADVLSRGKIPVIAGGTGMYIESLQKGIFDAPDRDKGLRAELEADAEVKGYEALHGELTDIDPEFAANVKPADRTRIIRGLELNRQLGMNVKEAQKKYHRNPAYKYNIFVIGGDRQKIYDRINLRVLEMFRTGWPAEVKKLLDMGYDESMDSFKAIGYREIAACIREGRDVNSCIERIQTATRNFAKRQQTWFRHMDETVHIDMGDPDIIKILTESIFT